MPRKFEKFKSMGCACCGKTGSCKLVLGIFLFLAGVSWFGNEAGWWRFNLPWVPLLVMLLGLCLVAKWAHRSEDQ